MINVGFLGLGHMGLLHLRNIRFIDDVRVVAAADKSRRALSEAKAHGAEKLFRDYRELLKLEDLDAVVIVLPNFLHKESAVLAAERGLHIFIEKPLACNVSECEEIRQVVHRNDVKLVVGHNYRYFDHVQKLKAELEKGTLGEIEMANIEHYTNGPFAHPLEPRPIPDWKLDIRLAGGGVLLDDGPHLIDLFRWFFPDAELLSADLGYHYGLDVEDSALLVLRSKCTSTRGVIGIGWFQKMVFPQFNFRINLQGTTRFLSTDHFLPRNLYFHAIKAATRNVLLRMAGKKIIPLSYTYYYTSYFKEMQSFFKSIKGDFEPNPLATVDDGLEAVRIVEKAYRLAKQG